MVFRGSLEFLRKYGRISGPGTPAGTLFLPPAATAPRHCLSHCPGVPRYMRAAKTVFLSFLFCLTLLAPLRAEDGLDAGELALLHAYHAMETTYEPDERSEHLPELLPLVSEERRPVWDAVLAVLGHVLRNEYGPAMDAGREVREEFDTEQLGPLADSFLSRQIGIGAWLAGDEEEGRAAFEEAFSRYRDSDVPFLRGEAARSLYAMGAVLLMQNRYDESTACFQRVVDAFSLPRDSSPEVARPVIDSLHSMGVSLIAQGDFTGAVDAFRAAVERCGDRDELAFRESAASALLNISLCYHQLDDEAEGLQYVEQLVKRFDDAPEPRLRAAVAKAMMDKVMILLAANNEEEARDCLETLLERYRDSREHEIEETVASALFAFGVYEDGIGNHGEAIGYYEEIEERFGRYADDAFVSRSASAMYNRGYSLTKLGEQDAAMELFDRVIDTYRGHDLDDAQEAVAFAMSEKATILIAKGENDEAAEVYRVLASRYQASEVPTIRERATNAELVLSALSAESGDAEAAMQAWQRIAREHGDAVDPGTRNQVAMAMLMRANALYEAEQYQEAGAAYQEIVDKFNDDAQDEIQASVCQAMFNQAVVASRNESGYPQAIAVYDKLIAKYGERDEPEFAGPAATAMLYCADLHGALEDYKQAKTQLLVLSAKVRDTDEPLLVALREQAKKRLDDYRSQSGGPIRRQTETSSMPSARVIVIIVLVALLLLRSGSRR